MSSGRLYPCKYHRKSPYHWEKSSVVIERVRLVSRWKRNIWRRQIRYMLCSSCVLIRSSWKKVNERGEIAMRARGTLASDDVIHETRRRITSKGEPIVGVKTCKTGKERWLWSNGIERSLGLQEEFRINSGGEWRVNTRTMKSFETTVFRFLVSPIIHIAFGSTRPDTGFTLV